jgi:hypothetical protein
MGTKIIAFLLAIVALNSCTTLYKTGQTPDDVYYSPTRPYEEAYVKASREEEVVYRPEDRVIRMGINDPRWRNFDQDYRYYGYNYGSNYGNYHTPYFSPVYGTAYSRKAMPVNTSPRKENLGGYSPVTTYTSSTNKMGVSKPVKSYNNTNNGSAVGNIIRQIFSPENTSNSGIYNSSNNSINNSSNNNTRTYSPQPSNSTSNSSSSSSGSSSSSSSGSISRPARGGGK